MRSIIHVDLDAFYASVEQLRRPELRGKPLIVGGAADSQGRPLTARGVVSAASYEARVFGVHSALPLATALRLCPQAIVVPVDFPAYRAASAQVFAIVRQYTPVVEPLSLDEAAVDVTGSAALFGDAAKIAATMRDRILAECGLHASFGVATTKTVAKIASDLRKPQGFVVVPPGEEAAFLAPLPLRRLPGLGPASEKALQGLGVSTLGQLAALPLEVVQRRLGGTAGRSLWERARGIDSAPVTVPGRPKSIAREETFDHDSDDAAVLERRLRHLAADVGKRLRAGGWQALTVQLKLRSSDFTTISRQETLPTAVDSDTAIIDCALVLFRAAWDRAAVRLLGVGVTHLDDAAQMDLFAGAQPADSRLDQTLDQLRERFGEAAPQRGGRHALRDLDWRGEDVRE